MTDDVHAEPKTVEEALELIAQDPTNPYLHQQLGGLYFRRRELMKAWHAYMDALKLDPNDPFTCLYFGNLLTICDDKEYAMKLYRHAVKNAPELPVVHWCMANLYRQMQQYDDADKAYRDAVAADPTDKQAREKLREWEEFLAKRQRSDTTAEI